MHALPPRASSDTVSPSRVPPYHACWMAVDQCVVFSKGAGLFQIVFFTEGIHLLVLPSLQHSPKTSRLHQDQFSLSLRLLSFLHPCFPSVSINSSDEEGVQIRLCMY